MKTVLDHPSPLAGQTIKVRLCNKPDQVVDYRVEDWWHRVGGKSWMYSDGNPACLNYAMRTAGLTPIDDKVLYGKIGGSGVLIHESEILWVESADAPNPPGGEA